jgi:hypothetical protein
VLSASNILKTSTFDGDCSKEDHLSQVDSILVPQSPAKKANIRSSTPPPSASIKINVEIEGPNGATNDIELSFTRFGSTPILAGSLKEGIKREYMKLYAVDVLISNLESH